MKIFIRVKPLAKYEKVERVNESNFNVFVNEPAKEGRANEAVTKVLAEYFGISKSGVRIISGEKSRQKIIEIL